MHPFRTNELLFRKAEHDRAAALFRADTEQKIRVRAAQKKALAIALSASAPLPVAERSCKVRE